MTHWVDENWYERTQYPVKSITSYWVEENCHYEDQSPVRSPKMSDRVAEKWGYRNPKYCNSSWIRNKVKKSCPSSTLQWENQYSTWLCRSDYRARRHTYPNNSKSLQMESKHQYKKWDRIYCSEKFTRCKRSLQIYIATG